MPLYPTLTLTLTHVADIPRAPHSAGWAAPTQASIQMMQSFIQAVPLRYRKGQGKSADLMGPLMQLPHFSEDTTKKLKRRR